MNRFDTSMHPNQETIGDYIDDALVPAERRAIDEHLARCGECRALVAELAELGQVVRALEPMDPPAGAWARIERAIREGPAPAKAGRYEEPHPAKAGRHVRHVRVWAAAAAVILVAVYVGLKLSPFAGRRATDAPASNMAATAQSVEAELLEAERHYQNAISGLERIANAEKGALDPQTAATLEKNLAVVDRAISESRTALNSQPSSEPAQRSLLESLKVKIALLQDTVALINEMRKGNEAGAARIVSGIKQKG